MTSVQPFIEDHFRNKVGGGLDWVDADPGVLVDKTVAESFRLDDSGYVVVCTDRSVYKFGHRIVYDGDWPEFEQFTGQLPKS